MKRFRPSIFMFSFVMVFLIPCSVIAEGKRVYTLEELLSVASETNPSASVFKANLEASKGEVISARAYPNPEIEFEKGRGKSLELTESQDEYSIGIGQPLEWPLKRFYRRRTAETEVLAVEKDIEGLILQIRAEVKEAFFQLLFNKKAVEIAKENSGIVEELLKTVGIRVTAGESPEFELVKAKGNMRFRGFYQLQWKNIL